MHFHFAQHRLRVPILLFCLSLSFVLTSAIAQMEAPSNTLQLPVASAPVASKAPEPAPVGSSPAHIFHAAPKDGSVDPHLAHSGIYTNPVAIEQIVDWIRRR